MTNNSFQYHTISVTPTFITISRSWFFKTHQAVPRLYRKDKKSLHVPSYASLKTTQPVGKAHLPPWTYCEGIWAIAVPQQRDKNRFSLTLQYDSRMNRMSRAQRANK